MAQNAKALLEGAGAQRILAATAHSLVVLAFLFFVPSAAGSQKATTPENPPEPYKISINVSSVVLHATVTNH